VPSDSAVASIAILGLTALAVLLGMAYFRRRAMPRPPLGVLSLGDVVFMLTAIVLIPYLYLALPGWLVAALLALGTLGLLQLLFEPLTPWRWLPWLLAAALVLADILLARQGGIATLSYLAVNDLVLLMTVVAVSNVWAQSGMRARDLAVLGGALALYDLAATSLLPLTNNLIDRLAGLPFTPVLAWPLATGGWVGIGLGDLLLIATGPLVLRKAFGHTAELVAMVIALASVAVVLIVVTTGIFPGTFPVMIVLGPLLVGQYLFWSRLNGVERTPHAYLRDEAGYG
jgi:hypothetical protein